MPTIRTSFTVSPAPVDPLLRAHLLAACGVLGGLAVTPGVAAMTPMQLSAADRLFGGARYREAQDAPEKFALARVVPGTQEVTLAHCGFFPHGWAIDPNQPKRIVLFEKVGPGAGVFDIGQMDYLGPLEPLKGRLFYGHGVFADSGRLLLSTESDPLGEGAVGVRDGKTLKYLGDFPTYGARPHDCALVEGGRVLVITNGGGTADSGQTPCVTYVDVKTRKLLRSHAMPGKAHNTGHMAAVSDRTALVVSAPRLGLGVEHEGVVSWCSASVQSLQPMLPPADLSPALLGEALSVLVVPGKDLAVVTHPTPGWLTFWKLSTRAFKASLRIPRVRGVALAQDQQSLWISHGAGAALGRVNLNTLSVETEMVVKHSMLAGSHLLNWPA